MRRVLMVIACFLTVVFILSANCVQADTVTFNAPLSKGTVFVVVTPEGALSPSTVTVKTAWGPWSRQEDFTVTPPQAGVVIKLKNGGSTFQTRLIVTATNGTVTKVIQVTEGQTVPEWNNALYTSVSW